MEQAPTGNKEFIAPSTGKEINDEDAEIRAVGDLFDKLAAVETTLAQKMNPDYESKREGAQQEAESLRTEILGKLPKVTSERLLDELFHAQANFRAAENGDPRWRGSFELNHQKTNLYRQEALRRMTK